MAQRSTSGLSRRQLVQAGLLAGAGAVLPAWAATSAGAVISKPIPSTGERLPVIGLGTDRFGWAEAADVREVIQRMTELGGTLIDTAGLYYRSEEMIGPALAQLQLRPKVFLSTKFNSVGATNDPPHDVGNATQPADPVRGLDSFERSLQRLQTDRVDLLMAHWLSSVDALMPVMLDLKKAGRVRYIGITTITATQQSRLAAFMRKYPVDFVQVEYSLQDRAAEQGVFPVALERNIAVSIAQPFGGDKNGLFSQIGDRKLPPWAAQFGIASWAQLFLKYVVSHPAVTCAVPGSTKLAHLEDNQAAGLGRLLDADTRKSIEQFWGGAA